ncbi:tRNA pseudouridine(55) synthase TruB [Erythrobacteraceae bacterium CFH 75059]|uniref:tRNA pseudouridine(55) synthase TruB n=1 Tax=Qipengyuania thermophila TaxID=2509361 RepID=UPI0010201039|nr:tRNA pseudouridine(55) synthase TruB [Qipengyuania thermophila]TCD04776.1 tRNA pseudouridine(55) synthase TruB [Erythrobacteraceae bacterium CFH 75059]
MADPPASPHGWLILDKPPGLGSTQAVAAVKRALREAGHGRVKVGHGGTLDPLAEGVLPVALGEATKLAGRMLDASKVYAFTVQFGEETDTLDAEGEVVARTDHRPPRLAIPAVLTHFTGAISQMPPTFSAIKVDGRRAYDRARAGEAVEMTARPVTVFSLEEAGPVLPPDGGATPHGGQERAAPENGRGRGRPDRDPPLASTFATTLGRPDPYDPAAPLELADSVTLVAHVSKGTYIRSLARDIARALGTLGHVTWLRRLRAGPFTEEQAISLDMLAEIGKGACLDDILLPLEAGLDGIPALHLDPDSARAVRQGRVISGLPHEDGLHLATLAGTPVALLEVRNGTGRVVRGFNIADAAE